MTQQTALEQLIEWIDSDCNPMDCVMKAKELLKVEKQQITDFADDYADAVMGGCLKRAEQYYNETYKIEQHDQTLQRLFPRNGIPPNR